MKNFLTVTLFVSSLVCSKFGFSIPPKKVDVPGRYITHQESVNSDGSNVLKIICSVVYFDICYTSEIPATSTINPNTQNGPIPLPDRYSNIKVAGFNNYGEYYAHFQHFILPGIELREHIFHYMPSLD